MQSPAPEPHGAGDAPGLSRVQLGHRGPSLGAPSPSCSRHISLDLALRHGSLQLLGETSRTLAPGPSPRSATVARGSGPSSNTSLGGRHPGLARRLSALHHAACHPGHTRVCRHVRGRDQGVSPAKSGRAWQSKGCHCCPRPPAAGQGEAEEPKSAHTPKLLGGLSRCPSGQPRPQQQQPPPAPGPPAPTTPGGGRVATGLHGQGGGQAHALSHRPPGLSGRQPPPAQTAAFPGARL